MLTCVTKHCYVTENGSLVVKAGSLGFGEIGNKAGSLGFGEIGNKAGSLE